MITIRNFTHSDAPALAAGQGGMTTGEAGSLIAEWARKEYEGRYFEMFAVLNDGELAGAVSLYQSTGKAVSIGIEIYEGYRRRGFAYEAMQQALAYAAARGYRIAVSQVRKDNPASIALHKKLGFECEHEYVNGKGNACLFFIMAI